MSKSQSKEFFKKKQRGQNKKNSTSGITISNVQPNKAYHIQTSHGSSTGLLGNGEDPAVVVINPHPPSTTHHNKEKRTKICCLL